MTTSPRVVKVGGRPQSDPALPRALARAWDALSRPMIVVHGGGDEVTTLQSLLGGSTEFVDGRRVTGAQDVEIVRMALSGSANKRLVAELVNHGIRAIGLSGEDAALLSATPLDPARLGRVGLPHEVDTPLLFHLIGGGYLPVISPVSRNAAWSANDESLGSALNVNGDDAAAAIAVAMAASELVFVADVPGVMSDGALVPRLDVRGARQLLAGGTAKGGMRAKLEAAVAAVEGGVAQVRIGDVAAIEDVTRGTTLAC
jgi:acetylglutamate kinase